MGGNSRTDGESLAIYFPSQSKGRVLTFQKKPYNVLYGPATREGNTFRYESSFVNASGLNYQNSTRSAFFCLTASGMLKMFWYQVNNTIEETTMELDSVNTSDDRVTHAAMASDKKSLLVAVATASKQLCLVKVDVQWGHNTHPDAGGPSQNNPLNPSFTETHLATANWLQSGANDANAELLSMAELSQLHVLPTLMGNAGKNMVPPMIIAVRTRTPSQGSFEVAQTVIERWEATEEKQELHPAFELLGTRRNSTSGEPSKTVKLRQLDPVIINKVCINFQTSQFGKVLILTFADGTVEYRDRFTFEELYAIEDTEQISNLRQVGWTYMDNGPCHQIAFSPTFCSRVQVGDDGKLRWSKLHYAAGDIGNTMQEPHYGGSIAGLVITAASAMYHQANYDDMLAMVQPFASKKGKIAQQSQVALSA
jgi:mediator of RNA polymerase II transcription subunit 16